MFFVHCKHQIQYSIEKSMSLFTLALASLRSLKKQSWKSASWRGLWKKENRSGGLVSESPSSARGMPETKF